MDQIENDKRDEISVNVFNNNRLETYSNITNVTQEQHSLNVPWDDVNAACDYTNDFIANNNVPAFHATAPMTSSAVNGRIDLTTQSYPTTSSNEAHLAHHNYVNEQVSIQNPPQYVMDAPSSMPADNSLPTNDSEVFRFVVPGFTILVIPTSPLAYLNNFDMQPQFQQDDFSSYNSSQSYLTNPSTYNIHNNQSQHHQYQQN
jgi:hypothetical protein